MFHCAHSPSGGMWLLAYIYQSNIDRPLYWKYIPLPFSKLGRRSLPRVGIWFSTWSPQSTWGDVGRFDLLQRWRRHALCRKKIGGEQKYSAAERKIRNDVVMEARNIQRADSIICFISNILLSGLYAQESDCNMCTTKQWNFIYIYIYIYIVYHV